MSNVAFKVGDRVTHKNARTGTVTVQVMAAAENAFNFGKRVNEAGHIVRCQENSLDATLLAALQTRLDAIDN